MAIVQKRLILLFFLSILLFSIPPNSLAYPIVSTNIETLSYKQEITIPIDTSDPSADYQPIDTRITFDQSCWAKNETVHSVRVAYDDGNGLEEIDSQIYDLSYTDETYIDACSLVFLIPKDTTGEETYYVLYDDQQTDPVSYEDHITIQDTHYYYEPISGQIMDFDYYRITQDGYVLYAICQKGELLGNGMSNAIIKLLPNSTEFTTTNAEQIASFYMSYSTDPAGTHDGSQWAKDIKKTVLVDGNLMTRIQMEGTSPKNDIKTNNIYTYYYCPTSAKHIHVNVNHEILQDITVAGTQQREGTYASLSTIKARSGTIDDMNLGTILPKIHIYTEDETTKTYDIPTDPKAHPAEWLLGTNDDQDLGSKAWFCIDDPNSGKAHGLLFAQNTGLLEGPNDGIQVKASVHQHVALPGLEADSGDLYALRNAYEDGSHSTTISAGTNVTFDVQYLALQNGGFEAVDEESIFYQTLNQIRPITRGNVTADEDDAEEKKRYTLTTYVHLAPSFPLGSLLSAGLGRNISYLSAEIYKENDLASSGSISRLKIGDIDVSFDNTTFKQKINLIRGMFDIKNSTLFKTIRFNDLESGDYLIKIYKENPLFGNDRKYIGYATVNLEGNTKTHIYCKQQTMLQATVTDQKDQPVEHARFTLSINDNIIAEDITDENGSVSLYFPFYKRNTLTLQGFYKGFLITDQKIQLKTKNRLNPIQKTINIERYNCEITVKDTLGLSPAVDINPMLTSNQMIILEKLQPATNKNNAWYEFTDLYPGSYKLKMSYKSFVVEETITLNKDTALDFTFPAEFLLDCSLLDSVGSPVSQGTITVQRQGKTVSSSFEEGTGKIIIPPGTYEITIRSDTETIASQTMMVKGDKSVDLVTNHPSLMHTVAPLVILLVFAGLALYFFWKKQKNYSIHFLVIAIVLLSLFFPWWMLSGDTGTVTTNTKTMIYPSNLITITTTDQVIGGEISSVPEEFTMILTLISALIVGASLLIALELIIHQKFPRISMIISIFVMILLILSAVLFYVAMSEVTKVGVGSFSDTDELTISIPGQTENVNLLCQWGPGIGFYLILVGFIIYLGWQMRSKLETIRRRMQAKLTT
ncbi:MAG: hypothetical protein R6U21_02060 [Thermoplasmatota archaeon]